MTDTVDTEVQDNVQPEQNVNADAKLEDALAQLEKQTKLVEKLRAQEKHNQQIAKDLGAKNLEEALRTLTQGVGREVDEWKTKFTTLETEYNTFKEGIKNKELDVVLRDALSTSQVKDINTTLKLIDKSKIEYKDGTVNQDSIKTIIDELRQTDPILFDEVKVPDVKNAGTGQPGGYEKELTACKNQKEIMAVMKKYNKI